MINMGPHLLLQVKTEDVYSLTDINHVQFFLEGLSKEINMTLVYPPIVARFPFANTELSQFVKKLKDNEVQSKVVDEMENFIRQKDKNMTGVSGIAIWLESHTAIHTWPEKYTFSLDAYSCKSFNWYKVVEYVKKIFKVKQYQGLFIERFIGVPDSIVKIP